MKEHIQIISRRWFDTKNGNTYHNVEVYVNNKFIGKNPFTYGYGESYLQTALEVLQKHGYYTEKKGQRLKSGAQADYYEFFKDMIEHRENFLVCCTDVTRKRDL